MKLFIITLNTPEGTQEFLQYSPDIAICLITQVNIGLSVRAIEEIPGGFEDRPEDIPWLVNQNYEALINDLSSFDEPEQL